MMRLHALRAMGNTRLLTVTLLSFASGLPLGLVTFTVPVWLRTAGVDLAAIGLFSLVGLPWGLKFLWSPLVDRLSLFGMRRRQGWMVTMQVALALACFLLAAADTSEGLSLIALTTLSVALFSATQDIAIDAYSVELMRPEEYGTGNGLRVAAYRVAMLVSGGVTVAAAQWMDWSVLFLALGAAFLLLAALSRHAPDVPEAAPAKPGLRDAVLGPFSAFLKTPKAPALILFILLFKFGDNLAVTMLQPFLVDQGYPLAEIGLAQKTVGLIATLSGAVVGGLLTSALGLGRGILLAGVLQAASHVGYWAMATIGFNRPLMYGGVALESFCGGIGTAAFLAFLMALCDKRYTATQYALLSSLFGLARTLSGAPSGFLAESLGYPAFFLATIGAALPGILLAWWVADRVPAAA